jgi:hypothetical protein
VFICRAANGALFGTPRVSLNSPMTLRHDSEFNDWRRRAQRGARDIVVAVALTVIAVGLIGVAWLGNNRAVEPRIGPSAEVKPL